jgi:hypothetical protein
MRTISVLLILLVSASTVMPQFPKYNQEFQISNSSQGSQLSQGVVNINTEEHLVCYSSPILGGSGNCVLGQRFGLDGIRRRDEFQISTLDIGEILNPVFVDPAGAGLSTGDFVVSWVNLEEDVSSNSTGIFAQLFDSNANKIGDEFQINTHRPKQQSNPKVTALDNGNFVVCWDSDGQDGSRAGIFAQIFNQNGDKVGSEFQVNIFTTRTQWRPDITTMEDGSFVIVWTSWTEHYSNQIFAKIYNDKGEVKREAFQVSPDVLAGCGRSAVSPLDNGGFVVVYANYIDQDGSAGIYAQICDSAGTKINEQFQVNTYTESSQLDPTVEQFEDGFFVCWASIEQDGSSAGVYGQIFDSNGQKLWSEFRINSYTVGAQSEPRIKLVPSIGYLVTWVSDEQDGSSWGVFGKYFPSYPQTLNLEPFSLEAPQDGSTVTINNPAFYWHQASFEKEIYPFEVSYDLYLDSNSDFSNPTIIKNIQDTVYVVDALENDTDYYWRVLAKNISGDSLWCLPDHRKFYISPDAVTGIPRNDIFVAENYLHISNYPNPFNPTTTIKYDLPTPGHISIKIFDLTGRLVKILANQQQNTGAFSVHWDGTDLFGNTVAAGIYVYRVEFVNSAGERFVESRKMSLVK